MMSPFDFVARGACYDNSLWIVKLMTNFFGESGRGAPMKRRVWTGFALVELVVVIAIIAALIALLLLTAQSGRGSP
jgi:hypothetical protein